MKLKARTLSPQYQAIPEKYDSFVAVGIVLHTHTRNNTDSNKLVIFSGIALYYGDTNIINTEHIDKML